MNHDRLDWLAACAEAGDIPGPTLEWLRDCLRRWQDGATLDQAFCVDGRNAREQRDELLRNAACGLHGSPWRRATVMAAMVWRLRRNRGSVPEWLRDADRLARVPESARQLYRVIR
jgi:hypothetical protein